VLLKADRRKDEFLAILAHELRNPLAPISNGLHLLNRPGIDGAAFDNIREMMERQVNHMVRLVDDLMEVSRITRGKIKLHKETVDLAEILVNAIETSRPLIDKERHQLNINLPTEALKVEADGVRMAQIITNILNNAAKYTPEGGHIWLRVWREGSEAIISVRDNGIGIPGDMLPKVFDLFTQVSRNTHRAQGGLGIGLTLVQTLVKLHGGSIEVHSKGINQGSEFLVRLPLVEAMAHLDNRIQDIGQPDYKTFQRILAVDDNRDAVDSLAMLLKQMKADVVTVYDGQTALDTIKSYRPSVVLLDIGMPGMDGFEVARRMRQLPEGKDIILIAMTGWGQEEDRRQSEEAGFNDHLVKPVDLSVLKELLANLPPVKK